MAKLDRYTALALQTGSLTVSECPTREEARELMRTNLKRTARSVAGGCAFTLQYIGEAPQLVVLPEYSLTGFPLGAPVEQWRRNAALDPKGEEYEELAKIAVRHAIYLAGNCYETDPGLSGGCSSRPAFSSIRPAKSYCATAA